MKIMAIETSCDETACAVVEDGWKVHANVIASQIDLHAKTGGVVPEVAARAHVLTMIPVLQQALDISGCSWDDIDALAVTKGPGLISSLIIGTETASVISYVKNKKLIPVQHIVGHIYSNCLERDEELEFPILILTVSGGHNELILMRGHHEFEVLGETLDDASGEAFDKVARLLGLGYPGGPVISKMAESGDAERFRFPRIMLEKDSLNFSFSGLKTAVLNAMKNTKEVIDEQFKADIAAGFQEATVDVLSDKLIMALKRYPEVKEVHLAGGVSANTRLREVITEKMPPAVKFKYPVSIKYCTDNAAMIASAAYYLFQKSPNEFHSNSNVIATTEFSLESF